MYLIHGDDSAVVICMADVCIHARWVYIDNVEEGSKTNNDMLRTYTDGTITLGTIRLSLVHIYIYIYIYTRL